MSSDAPCKGCTERKVTADYNCHSHCEKHAEFQKKLKLQRKIRYKLYEMEQARYESTRNIRKIAQKNERKDRLRRKKH